MMILFLVVTGAIIVFASYLSKWDTKKRMDDLRAKEAALKEKVTRFRAKEIAARKRNVAAEAKAGGFVVAGSVRKILDQLESASRGLMEDRLGPTFTYRGVTSPIFVIQGEPVPGRHKPEGARAKAAKTVTR